MSGDVGSSSFFTWEKHRVRGGSPLDDRVYNHRAVLLGGKIYLFGGHRKPLIFALDYTNSRWHVVSTEADLVKQCQFHTATLVDDCVFIIGGSVRGTARVPLLRFDVLTEKLSKVVLRGRSRLVIYNHVAEYFPELHEVLVYGRFKEKEEEVNELVAYDTDTSFCRSLKAKGRAPSLRIQMASCAAKHAMFVFAGGRRMGMRKGTEPALYVLRLGGHELTWSTIGNFKEPTARFSSLTYAHRRLFLYGGLARGGEAQGLRIFELGSAKWQDMWFTDDGGGQPEDAKFIAVGKSPVFPSCHSATYASGKLLIVGGYKVPITEFTSISAATTSY